MKPWHKSFSQLLREYIKAYFEGRVPEEYIESSLVTYLGPYRWRTVEVPLPLYDQLEEAVEAAKNRPKKKVQRATRRSAQRT